MTPKFRLEDVRVESVGSAGYEKPVAVEVVKIDYTGGVHQRCDVPDMGPCGCDMAEPKIMQEDIVLA